VILLPAIDIRGGRAVRLRQGDFRDQTVYAEDPLEAARMWVEAGARHLHVVDLDGARQGRPASIHELERITNTLDVPVQYGGGLRSADAVDRALRAGAARVVLGTAAYTEPSLLEAVVTAHGERVLVALDVRAGTVSVSGWTEDAGIPPDSAIERLEQAGVHGFVYTDVDRDGMLEGPDLDGLRRIASHASAEIVYSGGIGSLADLEALASEGLSNVSGVIVGKALYERRFTVFEAQAALRGPSAARGEGIGGA
jgi:phosphoribosylformimino-5-aminoimidazole carboxamide ribotide isomerase